MNFLIQLMIMNKLILNSKLSSQMLKHLGFQDLDSIKEQTTMESMIAILPEEEKWLEKHEFKKEFEFPNNIPTTPSSKRTRSSICGKFWTIDGPAKYK